MTSMQVFGPSGLKTRTGQFTADRGVLLHTQIKFVMNRMSLNKLHLEGTTFYRSIQWRVFFSECVKFLECLVNPTYSTIYISSQVFKLPHKSTALWILIQATKKFQVSTELERLVSYLERTDVALILSQYNPTLDWVLKMDVSVSENKYIALNTMGRRSWLVILVNFWSPSSLSSSSPSSSANVNVIAVF
jgi:hypothetical protein